MSPKVERLLGGRTSASRRSRPGLHRGVPRPRDASAPAGPYLHSMTSNTATIDSAPGQHGAAPDVDLVELRRLRIERLLIEAARDDYYRRWLADEDLIRHLRLQVKRLEYE